MALPKRLWAIVLGGLAVAAIMLLSTGLSSLELQPGKPLQLGFGSPAGVPPALPANQTVLEIFRTLWRVIAVVAIILLPVSIIQFIVSPNARRRIIQNVLRTLAFLLLYYLLAFGLSQSINSLSEDGAQGAPNAADLSPVEFTPPSDTVVTSISVVVAILITLLAWLVWRRIRPRTGARQQLAQQAQTAIDELRSGNDLKNTVIRCYYEMSQTLSRHKGIHRQRDMTAREFELRLADAGLPLEHIHRLTRLFEVARYSARPPGAPEEHEAISCLTAIVQTFGHPA